MCCQKKRSCCGGGKGDRSIPQVPDSAAINAKWSTMSDVVAQPSNSYPSIHRCTIRDSTFNNLSTVDSISRSDIQGCSLRSEKANDRIRIKRSTLKNTLVHNSALKRATLTDSNVSNVGYAKRVTGQNAHLDQVKYSKHCTFVDSSVRQSSILKWTDVKNSDIVNGLIHKRSKLNHTRVVNCVIQRSTLENCEVHDSVLSRCNFKGLILENGVWKNGNLVGRTSDKEAIVKSINEGETGHVVITRTRDVPIMTSSQVDSESDNDSISSASDAGEGGDREEQSLSKTTPLGAQEEGPAPPPYQP